MPLATTKPVERGYAVTSYVLCFCVEDVRGWTTPKLQCKTPKNPVKPRVPTVTYHVRRLEGGSMLSAQFEGPYVFGRRELVTSNEFERLCEMRPWQWFRL